ncbi:NADPH-dependent F420 reductase [Devosia sp. SL43]|uniref:NADPH-dependent F420 reductase n=1 Tax=Devosia sp. SL43 TaxID=2806348 RepID=UPI001F2507BB|nr:NAD(P)-binding domain-containing protein [Devosia sp. SL43]UJW84788.1 NAD(P)-binding domain-containing protein [Devosia sp. SL43]
MRFGVLGTGQVGSAVGGKLAALGHDVMFGSRNPGNGKTGLPGAKVGSHAEACARAQIVVNALPGEFVIETLKGCTIDGKIVIDISNYNSAVDQPIVDPLGELIQRTFPGALVVKTLNSVSAHLMVDPADLGVVHSVFIASNHAQAKAEVTALLKAFGWRDIIDLGDLRACRAMEQLIPLWMSLELVFDGPGFNLAVLRKQPT